MKQKTSRGSCGKNQKTVRLKETTERLTGRLHLSGLNFQTGKTGRDGAREVWWSPAAIHGEAGGSDGTFMISAPFASVGGGGGRRRALCRRRPLLRRTAVWVVVDLVGECRGGKIEEGLDLW